MYNISMKTLSSKIGLFILISYIWIAVFGLLQLSHMSHMGHGTHPCPFMVGQQSLCPMDTAHHLSSWQTFTTAVFPSIELLVLAVLTVAVFNVSLFSPPRFSYTRQRQQRIPIPLYQTLFSQGILHPKAP